jgi:gliding motility-associated-like protein
LTKILKHLSSLPAKIFLFCSILFLPHLASAQIDKQFWFVAPYVYDAGRDFDKPINVRITTLSAPSTVTISMPADPSFTPITRNINANSTVTVDLTPWITQLQNSPANTALNKGLLITSTADISAYYEVVSSLCNDCNPEIFSLKGKNALGTEFFISSQYNFDESATYTGATNSFDIVATKNNTHITITPSNDIVGHNANIPFTITLNAGQTYSAVATSRLASGHLQGSYVSSDNPVAVTLKDDLVQVSSCADLVGDQTVPTSVLGKEYIVTKGFLQSNDNIYILAVADGTSVYIDGSATPITVLAKGGSYTLSLSNPSTYIRSDKNIYVYQFTGNGCEAGSAIIPKINCTGSQSVSIVRSSSDLFAVMITTKSGNQGSFTVNGNSSLVKSTDFTVVPGTGGAYVTARVDLSGSATVGSALNFTNSTGVFSLGYINGGTNNGTRYGFFSDFKSSNVQNSSLEICPAGSVQLSAYGGVSYQWTPATGLSNPNIANPIASPTATTDYTVSITTADGCVDFATVHVAVLTGITPAVSIAASATNICIGTPVTFTATPVNGGTSPVYQWQLNGANTGTNSATYSNSTLANGDKVTCMLTSSVACAAPANVTSNSITVNVGTPATPSVTIATSANNVCFGTAVTFTATPTGGGTAPAYQWLINGNNAGTNADTFISSTLNTNDVVSCRLTSNAPCATPATVISNSIAMVINPLPVVNGGGDKIIELGNSIPLNAGATGSITDITWSPATGLDNPKIFTPIASPTQTTVYTLTVQNAQGCIATDMVKVTVQINITIPNTFTPNGDGVNDKWEIKNLADYPPCTVKVYSRWGQEVFISKGYDSPWDGTFGGKRLPFGTYYYVINLNNNTPPLSGYVTVIK